MNKELVKIFKESAYKPNDNLPDFVWNNIQKYEKRTTYLKFYVFSFVSLISFIGVVPMSKLLLSDLSNSGFYEYVSIVFSNNGTLAIYWRELAFSITESLPIISILYTLIIVFIFFLSLRFAIKQITRNQLSILQARPV